MYSMGKRVATLAVAVTLNILFVNISHGQGMTPVAEESGGMGYSMFGRGTIAIDDLNARLDIRLFSTYEPDSPEGMAIPSRHCRYTNAYNVFHTDCKGYRHHHRWSSIAHIRPF